MLDQNTDRMWYVIGAVLIGAAIIFGMNTLMPELFASVTENFEGVSNQVSSTIEVEMKNQQTKKEIKGKEIANVTEGLLLYYDLTQGSGNTIIDRSGNGKNATLVGFNHNSESGWVDNGLLFDDVDDYAIGPSNLVFPDNTITLQARVSFHGLDHEGDTGTLGTLLKKGHPDNVSPHTGFALSYENRGGRSDFSYTAFGNPSGGFNGGGNSFDGRNSHYKLENNRTYSLTVTVDENAVGRIYIDGMLKFEKQFTDEVNLNNSDELLIGMWTKSMVYHGYSKTIESIRIYDRTLDPLEVLMNHKYDTRSD